MSTAYREVAASDRRVGSMLLPRLGALVASSIVAALVFAMLEMVLVAVVMGQPWYGPLHMIAAIVLGPNGLLPPPASFNIGIAGVAMVVHLVMAIVYGFVLSAILLALRRNFAWIAGLAFGIALYYINSYGFTALFPWFAEGRGWIGFVSHAVFGLVLALVYRKMDAREGSEPTVRDRPAP